MGVLFTTIAAVLIFAILIFIHEIGHFIAAKLSGVRVNEFALGMGPKIIKFQKGETLYSVRAFPIGGFCALEGEDEDTKDPRAFSNKPAYKRLIILAAGAFMNILLGFILLFSLGLGADTVVVPEIKSVAEGGSAESAGLRENDRIIYANGKRVHIMDDFSWAISNNTADNGELNLVVKNNGEKRNVSLTPKMEDGKKVYGIMLKTEQNSVFKTVKNSWYRTGFYSGVIVDSFVNLIKGNIPMSQISGPVGIVSEIGNAVEETRTSGMEGFLSLISLTILLTINLGVFNLLPLPALDGGRILFVLIELVLRKPVPRDKEAIVHFIGLVLLLIFSAFIAFKDVIKLF